MMSRCVKRVRHLNPGCHPEYGQSLEGLSVIVITWVHAVSEYAMISFTPGRHLVDHESGSAEKHAAKLTRFMRDHTA